MLQRSLYVFGALVLLGLALTLGYAGCRFRGPGDAIADAQALFDRGDFLRVVNALDISERSVSLQRDPDKLRELYRLRYRAKLAMKNNAAAALRDLDHLLAMTKVPGEDLQLDHIRLLAMTGNGETALQQARAFLAKHPNHGPALELAGEACQATYSDELGSVLGTVDREVGPSALTEARPALLAYLYRPDGDVEVDQGFATLGRFYGAQGHMVAAWPSLQKRLRELRTRVQQSLTFYQQSLELPGQQVAAMHGMALSLDQSNRFADLMVFCEGYRVRFDHQFVNDAGAAACWMLLRNGLDAAALAAAERWLPAGTAAEKLAARKLGPATADLLVARTLAAWRLRDGAELDRIAVDCHTLALANFEVPLARALSNGFAKYLHNDHTGAEHGLHWATGLIGAGAVPHGQQDLLRDIMPARLDNLRRDHAEDGAITALLTLWAYLRKNDVAPMLALAEYQLETGKTSAAMVTIDAANNLSPTDERVLALRMRAANVLYRDANQDGDGLLQRCLQRESPVPEVPHPVGYLLCAEAALAAKVPLVALASARAAVTAMHWARAGRILEARAELLADRPQEAARLLRQLIESMPADADTFALALQAHRIAGLPAKDLLWRAVRTMPPNVELTAQLLRMSQADGPAIAMPFALPLVQQADLDPTLRALAATAFARAGNGAEAERMLALLRTHDEPNGARQHNEERPGQTVSRTDLAVAVASLLRERARSGVDDAALVQQAQQLIVAFRLDTASAAKELQRCARDLAEHHPRTAYGLLTAALASADPEDRCGTAFAEAGHLAMRIGEYGLAEAHWTAALAFPDGRVAAEPLARLCFAWNRPERALQVYALATQVRDAALAQRCGNSQLANTLVTEALGHDAGDLLAQASAAAAGIPSLCPELVPAREVDRDALLELLSMLRVPDLAALALARARAFAATYPVPAARLLLARALLQANLGQEAAVIHHELWSKGLATTPFWREVALAATSPDYELSRNLALALAAAANKKLLDTSPYAYAYATKLIVDSIEEGGSPAIAARWRTSMWLQFQHERPFPEPCRPTMAQVQPVIASGQWLDAWWILDRIRPTLRGEERALCVEQMLTVARHLAAAEVPELQTLYGAVRQLASAEGAHGSIVHFLLEHGGNFPKLRPTEETARQLLIDHLDRAAAGLDPSDRLRDTVHRLVNTMGLQETLGKVEEALARHPTSLALWSERTQLLSHQRSGREGIAEMRRVLANATAPERVVEVVVMAGAEFAVLPSDTALLESCGDSVTASPMGRLAAGLVQLRLGRPDLAIPLLEGAAECDQPIRLQALAEALLQSRESDALARAKDALEQLTRDYPSSSEARNAGSFARQLAPR